MPVILGLPGSLRRESFNGRLLAAAADLVPEGTSLDIASIRGIPLYDGDLEAAEGLPAAVRDLKDRIAAADGLLIATPEYNNSIPGVVKNAIDWLSRPPGDVARVFRGKPVAVIGATTGLGATALAQAAWLPVVRALGMQAWFGGRLGVPSARQAFDDQGRLADEQARERLRAFMADFSAFVARQTGR
ncbi:MAG: NAD(P)H-dependent oxidoreductase [Acidimicrobiia bacterium]|nr:NAD(P)H-dependent oxidoreductase [Acidimicrobiia bacterium]